MSTEAQIEANRANAQASTGPVTDAGKAASSQNARTHGLSSPALQIPEHEREEYEFHSRWLHHEIDPIGAVENDLFTQMLDASWRLRRIQRLENEIFQNEANPLDNPESTKKLDRLDRYRGSAERSYQRAMKALREAQTNNATRDLANSPVLHNLSGLVDVQKIRKHFERTPGRRLPQTAAPAPASVAVPSTMTAQSDPSLQ